MPRTGSFQTEYDPDEAIPLPRPFRLSEGGRREKPLYPKGAKPQKAPRFPSGEQALRDGGFKYYPTDWLKDLPHIKKNIAQVKRGWGWLDATVAKVVTGDAKAKAGMYTRTLKGYKYNVLSGKQDIPVYRYARVDDRVVDMVFNTKNYKADPKSLLIALRFLYRNKMMKAYYKMVEYARLWTSAINERLSAEAKSWIANYDREVAAQMAAYQKYRDWWKVS